MYIDLNALEPFDIRFDEVLSSSAVNLDGGEDYWLLELRVFGRAVRDQPGQVALDGVVEARLGMRCVRCLEPFENTIRVEFELILVPEDSAPAGEEGERETEQQEALLFHGTGGRVALADVAREQIHLHLPQKPLCRTACRGLCPTCGTDRNRLECACRSEGPDERLAPLLELKRKLRGS